MARWTTLKTVSTANVTLRVEWTYDDDYVNDVQDEDGNTCQETQDKLDSGEWTAYGFRVVVCVGGLEVAEGSLWGSIYASPEEALEQRVSGYLGDMVSEACREARKTMNSLPRLRAA